MYPTLEQVVTKLNSPKRVGHSYMALCPYHDDTARSLQVGPGPGFYCHGCQASGNLNGLAEYLGVVAPGYFLKKPSKHSAGGVSGRITGVVTATYDYRDADGTLMYQVVRYDPKDFRCRRQDINGKWVWNIKNVLRILYKLPEIIARPDDIIVYVEGEKDADALHELGLLGTTTASGAGKFSFSNTECLARRNVCVIPDNDVAGRKHAEDVKRAVVGRGGRCVVLDLFRDRLGAGVSDVSDWLDAGGTGEELKRLIEEALQ